MLSADQAHHDLVDQIVARGSLWSRPLVEAFRATPRHLFLDQLWSHREGRWYRIDPAHASDDELRTIYTDRAVTTRLSQPGPGEHAVALSSSSQPSLMAQMLEDLHLRRGLRVLEIGAGTGYNAALLAHVVGAVVSIDVDGAVLDEARRHLLALPDRRVHLHHVDGRWGYPPAAPYDRIQVTAATDDVEPAWLSQLARDGIVQAPFDVGPGLAWLLQGIVNEGVFEGRLTRAAYFMPLRDEGDPGRDRNVSSSPVPGPDRLQSVPAPWAGWHDLRSGSGGTDFLPSLAVLGWLEGLTLGHATCPDGRPGYGLADLVRGEACWLGPHEWRITGTGGHQLGRRLWRQWLDLGAPRPTQWRLRAVPRGGRLLREETALAAHHRQGPRCEQLWELVEPRGSPVE